MYSEDYTIYLEGLGCAEMLVTSYIT